MTSHETVIWIFGIVTGLMVGLTVALLVGAYYLSSRGRIGP